MEHIAFSLLRCILLMGVVVDKFKGVQNLFIESVQGRTFGDLNMSVAACTDHIAPRRLPLSLQTNRHIGRYT